MLQRMRKAGGGSKGIEDVESIGDEVVGWGYELGELGRETGRGREELRG